MDKKKNVIIDGHFIKILYSNEYMELNGLYVSFKPFYPTKIIIGGGTLNAVKSCTKYALEFNPFHFENSDLVNRLCHLERAIIEQYITMEAPNKIAAYNLRNQLMTGSIKIQSINETNFDPAKSIYALKISGVWETNTSVGITVKFIHILS